MPFVGLNFAVVYVFVNIMTMSIGDFLQGGPFLRHLLRSIPLTLLIFTLYSVLTITNFLDSGSRFVLKKKILRSSLRRLIGSVVIGAGVGLCFHQIVITRRSCSEKCLLLSRSLFLIPSMLTLFGFAVSPLSRNLEFVPSTSAPPSIMFEISRRIIASSTFTFSRSVLISVLFTVFSWLFPYLKSPSLLQSAYIPFLVSFSVSMLRSIFDSILVTVLTYPMDFCKLELHNARSQAVIEEDIEHSIPSSYLVHCLSLQPFRVPEEAIGIRHSSVSNAAHDSRGLLSSGSGHLRYRGSGSGMDGDVVRSGGNGGGGWEEESRYLSSGHRGPSTTLLEPLWKKEMTRQLDFADCMLKAMTQRVLPSVNGNDIGSGIVVSWQTCCSFSVPKVPVGLCVQDGWHLQQLQQLGQTSTPLDRNHIQHYSQRPSKDISALRLLGKSLALHDVCRVARASSLRRAGLYRSASLLNTSIHSLCSVIDTTTLQVLTLLYRAESILTPDAITD